MMIINYKMSLKTTFFTLFLGFFLAGGNGEKCNPRDFGQSSIVCVCSATFCDNLERIGSLPRGYFYQLVSNRDGRRFQSSLRSFTFSPTNETRTIIDVDRTIKFQKLFGFGGSFTDAAGINIASVSGPLQNHILELGQHHFALAPEDLEFKIPYIKEAYARNPKLKMMASPWSAPRWMKTNNEFHGYGQLKEEYFQSWANYFIRFLQEYQNHGLEFWSITAQNEPYDGYIPDFSFNCMGWTPEGQRDWINGYLGPALEGSAFSDVHLITLDDQRLNLLPWSREFFNDSQVSKYISGIGLHWYTNFIVSPSVLDIAHEEFPDFWMIATEACAGYLPWDEAVLLGSWERAEAYASNIIEDLNHWVTGWIDWNLALDMIGGPNWAENYVDAAIIIDSANDLAYKQPIFYAIGHLSKFLEEGTERIQMSSENLSGLEVFGGLRPDGRVAIVILNQQDKEVALTLRDPTITVYGVIEVEVEARSIYTIVYN